MRTVLDNVLRAGIAAGLLAIAGSTAHAAGEAIHIERNQWNFGGLFGQFDRPSCGAASKSTRKSVPPATA